MPASARRGASAAGDVPTTTPRAAGRVAQQRQSVRFGDAAEPVLATPQQARLSTGLKDLDAALGGGLQPGRFYLVVSGPGTGGSLLAAGAARAAAFEQLRPVLYGASGPSREDLVARMTSAHLRIDYQDLRSGALEDGERSRAQGLAAHPGAALLHIDDSPGLTADVLVGAVAGIEELVLVVVDRMRLVGPRQAPMSGRAAVVRAAAALTGLARARGVAVLAVLETGEDDKPVPELGADVTVTLSTGRDKGVVFARIEEQDLGQVARVELRTDFTHARLTDPPPPPFNPYSAFLGDEGEKVTADLVAAARPYTGRWGDLPGALSGVLHRLVENVDAEAGGDRGGFGFGRGGVCSSQQAVTWAAAERPHLPDTGDGRRLQTALAAFLDYAVDHGYRLTGQQEEE